MNLSKYKNKWNKTFAVFIILFSIVYSISPVDISPDVIPIIGWLDDICLTLAAVINLYLQWRKKYQ